MGDDFTAAETRYLTTALAASAAARAYFEWMEGVAEQLAPERSQQLANETRQRHCEALRAAKADLDASPAPSDMARFADRLAQGLTHAEQSCTLFAESPHQPPVARIPMILESLHHVARAQECLYVLRHALTPLADFWQVPGLPVADATAGGGDEGKPRTGIVHVSAGGHHGGFSLYVPETYSAERAWPVIVALHGGSGNGRDFLWLWLREAKSFGYLLLAPSAVGSTWGPTDDHGLLEIIVWLGGRYRVDTSRILLTGLSDGATFGVLYGLAHPDVYRALAPCCGVLHPANASIGNLQRAQGVPIYLVHGALDFLFPVALARMARETLSQAGADVCYRELPELSHTYPRSENVRILQWFAAVPARGDEENHNGT